MKIIILILMSFLLFFLCCNMPPEPTTVINEYSYFITFPRNYDEVDMCPLILFLHGQDGASRLY